MEILSGILKIESPINLIPHDIKINGINNDGNIIFKYSTNKINYYLYLPKKNQQYIFFEILNNSLLWIFKYEETPQNIFPIYGNINNSYQFKFTIHIENMLINNYINTSLALNYVISEYFNQIPFFTNTDFNNKSLIPYIDPIKPPFSFKMELYNYQQRTLAKMLQIEQNQNQSEFIINYTYNLNFNGINILYDPIFNSKVSHELKFKIKTSGGILSDEMGLGKTISSIALITSNPAPLNNSNIRLSLKMLNCQKITSKATLIICPSHLTNQWELEIKRCDKSLKILTILTKNDYNNLIFNDFINSDIIITSQQFIMNFKFYPTLHYKACSASSFNFTTRNDLLKKYLHEIISNIGFPAITDCSLPLFEFFYFHRLILDEGHEIFGELLSSIILSRYMSQWISTIDANYYWYISGTPFINLTGIKNCAKFINLQLEDSDRDLIFHYSWYSSVIGEPFLMNFMNKEYIWNKILSKIAIRHRKIDIENQIEIPGYQELIIWLKFTDLERQLYNAKKDKVPNQHLQQLCCHPLIVESSKKIFGDIEVDLSLMQDKLITYHKNNYENYKIKLANLDKTNQAYHMLKKSFETHISESKYLFTILENMKSPDIINAENCSICMDQLDNPAITACGHLFCYDCLKMCLVTKKRCPMCNTDLTGKDLMVMNLKKNNITEENNPLIQKYGSKLGKLISIIRQLVVQKDTRIIVFSQWTDMLLLVGKTLAENGIENCFVKGNVWARNSAINKFKTGKNKGGSDNKVIMLSLKHAASGTNLTEATHIFFIEPIDSPREESKAIESQAIARACRIGQKQKIMLIRILIENTIEEHIFRHYYDKDIIVSFEEQNYNIGQNNSNISINTIPETNKTPVKRIRKSKNIEV